MGDMRPPHETKEIGIKRLKENYERTNRSACSSEQIKKFEKLYEREVLPQVYDRDKK